MPDLLLANTIVYSEAFVNFGGEGGIRTHGTVSSTTLFESVPINQLWHLSGYKIFPFL
jgi:hypothetical protein